MNTNMKVDVDGALWDALEKEMANKFLPKDEIELYQADLCNFFVHAFLMLESVKPLDQKLKDPVWFMSINVKELASHVLKEQERQ